MAEQTAREREIAQCKRTILEHREVDAKIKELRESTKDLQKQFAKTENDLKALQSVGQIIGGDQHPLGEFRDKEHAPDQENAHSAGGLRTRRATA